MQRAGADGQWREHPRSPDWVGYAVADVLEVDVEDPAKKAKVKQLLKTWISNDVFEIEEQKDDKRRVKKFVRVGEWV